MPPKGKGTNKRGNWNTTSKNATLDMTRGADAMNLFLQNPFCGNTMFPQPAAGMASMGGMMGMPGMLGAGMTQAHHPMFAAMMGSTNGQNIDVTVTPQQLQVMASQMQLGQQAQMEAAKKQQDEQAAVAAK